MWWIVATLILAGILLMLIEMLLVPGVGVAGVLSLASFGASCWYSFRFLSPAAGRWVTVGVLLILVGMLVIILSSKTWKKFELKTEVTSKMNAEVDRVHVGDRGVAQTRLAPMGTGKFASTSCEVKSSDNSMIAAGTPIEVVELEDNKAIVKPIKTEE